MKSNKPYTGFEVAIIGLSCRFPGANTWRKFWENLTHARESFRALSDEEMRAAGAPEEAIADPTFIRRVPDLTGKDTFDASFFDYTPDEAGMLGPQNRIFHECVWEAFEDAGYVPDEVKGLVGLYGSASNDMNWRIFAKMANQEQRITDFLLKHISDKDFLPPMISYKLNMRGASMNLGSACSSTLVGIHLACRALIFGEVNVAAAGGAFISTDKQFGYRHEEGSILSSDGHCRAFDKDSSGTIIGEGAGAVILKRLVDAQKDGDHIYAIIKGSAVNNDGGRKIGLTAPSVEGQAECIKMAQRFARVKADSIRFIETHGTGTSLGDMIEIAGLNAAFGEQEHRIPLGSVKSNIGHLDTVAGLAGLMKATLSLKYKQLPASLHFNEPNPMVDFKAGPFYVNKELQTIESIGTQPLRAGVSSLGVGGTNAHTILEEAPALEQSKEGRPFKIFTLSAKTKRSLQTYVDKLQQFVKNESTLNESDAAYTFQLGRKHFTYRLPIVFENRDELMEKLAQAAASQTMQQAPLNEPSVIFLFPGQGAQYLQMGRQLYDSEPLFRDHLDQGLHWLKANTKIDFKQILYPEDEPVADINETRYAQPLIFIFEYALAQLVLSYGIRPQTMIGHSIGEYTAAVLSGVFQYEDALSLLVNRGQMMFDLPTGDMLSVALSEEEVQPFLMDGVDLAAANGPTQSVLSGPAESIAAVKARLDAADVLCKILRTSHAFHSSMLDPILEAYRQAVAAVKPQRPKVAFMSNLTGAMIDPERAADPDYWVQHMRQAVRFSKGAAALLEQFPKAVFIEVGPGRTLSGLLRQHRIDGKTPQAVNLIKTPKSKSDDLRFFTEALAKLWSQGVAIDWAAYHQHPRRRVSLPTYAFEPIKYPTLVDPFAMLIQSIKGKEADASKVDVSTLQEQEIFSMDESMDDFVIEKVERPNLSTSFRKAETQTEEALLQLCEAFFGLDKLGAEDDIFELGADSLKIMTLSKRIHKHFGLELPQQAYYEHSVIRDLAAIIDAKGQQTEERLDISTVPLSKSGYPLSTSQEKIWLSSQFKEGSITYNIPLPINLEGDYDVDCLSKAFDAVIERHESLRTVFRENAQGAARQWILSGAELGFSFRYEDLRSREEAVRLAARAIEADAFQVFDLQNGPLLRACLFHLKEQQFLLFVNIHHIISDDWSLEVLSNEVLAHYHFFKEGTPLQVPELKIQYKDFASWQLVQLKGEAFQKLETYWLNKLSEPLPLLDLPGHKKRPIVKTFNGYSIENYFSVEDSQTLKTFCTAQKGSLFMGMLAAWYVLFYKYTGQKDFVIGSPVSGRTHTDLENQIGCYFNTLAIRMQINPEENFTDFFQRVKQSVLEDYNHQAYPFEELLEHFKLNSDLSRNPVFDLMFSFHNTMEYKVEESERNPDQFKGTAENAKLDILLNAAEHGPNLYLYINYNTDLYEQSTMERLVLDYKRLLKKLLEQPKQALKKVDYQLELAQDLRAKNKSRLNKMKNKIK